MREITVKIYQYDELTSGAKQKARDWFREGYDGQDVWDNIRDDAKEIGLRIAALDQHRANSGTFLTSARECADKILKNHGETCATYKTAKAYIKERDTLAVDDDGDFIEPDKADENAKEFLDSLIEDYRIMLDKEYEFQTSDETVEENIRANEYEFDEYGRRA